MRPYQGINAPVLGKAQVVLRPIFSRGTRSALRLMDLATSEMEFDDRGMAVFLRLGNFVGEYTPFRDIAVQKLSLPNVSPYNLTRQQAIDAYIDVFRTAVARVADTGVILLSGGRDSRHIALELHRLGLKQRAITLDFVNRNDANIASSLAATLGFPHIILPEQRRTFALTKKPIADTDYCSFDHAWNYMVYEACRGSCVYDGLAGDVLSAGLFHKVRHLELMRAGRLEELARELLPPDPLNWIDQEFRNRWTLDLAVDTLVQELRRHQDVPNCLASFYFANRTYRSIAQSAFGVFRDFDMRTPFLNVDVVQFLLSLPGEMVVDHKFHDEALQTAFPNVQLPYAVKHGPKPWQWRSGLCAAALLEITPPILAHYAIPRLAVSAAMPARVDFTWLAKMVAYFHSLRTRMSLGPTGRE